MARFDSLLIHHLTLHHIAMWTFESKYFHFGHTFYQLFDLFCICLDTYLKILNGGLDHMVFIQIIQLVHCYVISRTYKGEKREQIFKSGQNFFHLTGTSSHPVILSLYWWCNSCALTLFNLQNLKGKGEEKLLILQTFILTCPKIFFSQFCG